MPEKLITVVTFWTPEEAHLARNRLEAEGIRTYLADELTVSTDWGLANAIQGIKLQVAEEDAEKAVAFLESTPRRKQGDGEKENQCL